LRWSVLVDAVSHVAQFFSFVVQRFIRWFIRQRRRVVRAQLAVSGNAFVIRRTLRVQLVAPVGHTVARPIDFDGRPVIIRWSDFDARRLERQQRRRKCRRRRG
jgi:hypothetical protein